MSTIVLHNLPVGCMESDIHRALLIYGTAVNIAMDTRTSQAVVTMRTQQEAQALLSRHSVNVSGTSVRVDRQQSQPVQQPLPPQQQQQQQHQAPLPSMGMPSYNYANAPGAMYSPMPPSQSPMQQPYYASSMAGGGYAPPTPPSHLASGSGGAIMPAPPQTSRRLKVVVEDCRYPITRDVLSRMFGMIAPPVMVTCGPYGPTTTGMVEFADAAAAQQAVDQFHGKAVYPDCCYVKLLFEPMWEVPAPNVRPGATPSADYAYARQQPDMPGSTGPYATPSLGSAHSGGWDPRDERGGDDYYGSNGAGRGRGSVGGRGQGFAPADDGRREYALAAGRGGGVGGSGDVPHGLMVRGGRGAAHGPARGGGGGVGFSPYDAPTPPVAPPTDCAVLLSDVPVTVPLHDLWVLAEVYGNVRSLKRQHANPTQVVAQFYHVGDTGPAVLFLHGCPFRGSRLRAKRFLGYRERHTEWNLGPATDPTTHAALFEGNVHHRAAPSATRVVRRGESPAPNLYISNLDDSISDADLEELMGSLGFHPTASYRRGPKTCIVGFKDVETAVDALIALYRRNCRDRTLYVTFSRFPPGPPPPRPEHAGGKAEEGEHAQAEEGEDQAKDEKPHAEPAPPPEKADGVAAEQTK